MASIFKRRKGKNVPYTIQYVDHLGKRRTKMGFTDKGLSEQLASKLESDARLRSTGLISPEQDAYATHGVGDIEDHVSAFESSQAKNATSYSKLLMFRIRRIVQGCKFESLGAVNPDKVRVYLDSLRKEEDLGNKTYNHYLGDRHFFELVREVKEDFIESSVRTCAAQQRY
jgi:hypothetical protein